MHQCCIGNEKVFSGQRFGGYMVFVCLNVNVCVFGKIWFLSQEAFWMTRYLTTMMMYWLQ